MNSKIQHLEPLPGMTGRRLIIAGPCSAESPAQTLSTASQLAEHGITVFRAGVWKPRTMPGSFEGVGAEALGWLAAVKESTGMLTATEVANAAHVEAALASGVDYLWLGARTVANPFAVQEIADAIAASGKHPAVLVKNPVSPDIDLWIGALQRIYDCGVRRLGAVHRGFTSYGSSSPYRNEPHWSIPFELRRRVPGLPVLCDPSHIAGRRDLVETVARRAAGMGFDGFIIESHCDPGNALSDAAQQLTPADLAAMLVRISHTSKSLPDSDPSRLEELRRRLDAIDDEIISLLESRMNVSAEIGRYKKERGMTAVQPERYTAMVEERLRKGESHGLGRDFLRVLWAAVHEESVRHQIDQMN